MNPTPSPDPELRELLQSWRVEPRQDTALARAVWARLEQEKPQHAGGWFERLSQVLARPLAAFVAVAVFAALGALAGQVQNSHRRDSEMSRLATEYARSIDPILMTHSADHAGQVP